MPEFIPALPANLREVPDLVERGDERNRERWFRWKDGVLAYRELIHRKLKSGEVAWADIKVLCAADPAYALCLFGVIYEPRLRGGRGGTQPFIPFGWQVALIRWWQRRMALDYGDGYISKARTLGATWVFCWIAIHGWLFTPPFDSLLVSRNGEQVDNRGDKKSMFYKIDFFFSHLPEELIPAGWDIERHRRPRLMMNPENGNTIAGDMTTVKAGRGDRSTFMLYDEAAAIPYFDETWGTGSGTTDHRFAISTESMEEGGVFNVMWKASKAVDPDSVLELEWWRNPYLDEAWFEATRARHEQDGQLHVFEREFLRNMYAGFGSYIYEYARNMQAQPIDVTMGQGKQLYCCIDPGVLDPTAMVWVLYDPGTGSYEVIEAYMRAGQDSRFYASIATGVPVSGPYDYDWDAREVMQWTSRLIDPIIYVGDPYGDNRGGESGMSFYEGMAEKSREITGGRTQILVMTHWEPDDRGLEGRQEALREILPKMKFNDTPRVRRVLAALGEYRYKDLKNSREVTSISKNPIRIAGDHYIAALEYLAVHRRVGRGLPGGKRQGAVRQTGAGKTVGHVNAVRDAPVLRR